MEKVAQNYAQWMHRMVKEKKAVSATIYSSREFELTIDAMAKEFNISNDQIRTAEQKKLAFNQGTIKINFNTSKKIKEDVFAEIIIEPTSELSSTHPIEEKNFYYGLFILGTEKHDSRRIDNQLRGRAGRQGDPGVSQFFVAMDDEIMRKMGGDKIQAVARLMLSKEDLEQMAFTQKQFTNSIQKAQKQMEGRHFGIRKHLFDYDSVINKQRTSIYGKRDEILRKGEEEENPSSVEPASSEKTSSESSPLITPTIVDEIKHFIDEIVEGLTKTYASSKPWNMDELLESLEQITTATYVEEEYLALPNDSALEVTLTQQIREMFDAKFEGADPKKVAAFCRRVYLTVIDRYWMEHIDEMQYLREKVSLYGYAQIDPLIVYKKESYDKFQRLLSTIKKETLADIFRADVSGQQTAEQIAQQVLAGGKSLNMVDLLKTVTSQLKGQAPRKSQPTKAPTTSGSDEGVEVLEIEDDGKAGLMEGVVKVQHKLRPNDKVSVRYADGRIVEGKYKKVKEDIDEGRATVLGS